MQRRSSDEDNEREVEMSVNHEKFNDIDFAQVDEMDEKEMPEAKSKPFMQRVFETIIPPGGIVASAFTLGSATLGAGVLGIPIAFRNMGLGLALIVLIIMTMLTIYSCWLIARCADITGQRTFPQVARALLGRGTDIVIGIFLIGFCLGCGVSYIIAIGNLFTPIFDSDDVPKYLRTKSGNRLITSMLWLVAILPMCLLKNIDSLRYVSLLAVTFVFFFIVCVVINSSMFIHANGWREDVHAFNTGNQAIVGLGSIMFACLVQMNAFEIYFESDKPTPRNMVRNCCLATGGCCTIYVLIGVFGYARFGDEAKTTILLLYQPRDTKYMWPAYFGFIVKLCVGFALHNIPIRDSVYHFVGWDVYRISWIHNACFCAALSTVVLIAGLFIPSIDIVLGLVGALCGGFVGSIYPALMIMYTGNYTIKRVGFIEWGMTYFLLIAGVIGVVFGTIASIYDIC